MEGVEVVETQRDTCGWLAENLSGRIGFEANVLPSRTCTGSATAVSICDHDRRRRAVARREGRGGARPVPARCAITDRMFERLVTEVKFVGRRERDVAWDIQRLFHEEGAEAMSFESIVGSGPTGSQPHARAGDKVIESGELVVIDTAAASAATTPTTRGRLRPASSTRRCARRTTVLAAQQAGLDAIRAGVTGIAADAAARAVIDATPFAGTFGHGLGHGLGLDVHEAPRLSTESTDMLAAGNVVTVEPGVYVAGRFGIRIEDDVFVTEDGIENPVRFTKELITVG